MKLLFECGCVAECSDSAGAKVFRRSCVDCGAALRSITRQCVVCGDTFSRTINRHQSKMPQKCKKSTCQNTRLETVLVPEVVEERPPLQLSSPPGVPQRYAAIIDLLWKVAGGGGERSGADVCVSQDLTVRVGSSFKGKIDYRPVIGDVVFGDNIRMKAQKAICDLYSYPIDFEEDVKEYQRALITGAMEKAGGIKARAADLLGMKRTTLAERMKALGMEQ